ncbi:MAG: outer membrane homotrimeric porin [Pseudomonadota bacterium]
MKRIVTLLLAAGLVMGAYTGAQAADVKISGKWNFGFNFTDNLGYGEGEDDFEATQRLRLQMDIIASENLKGVIFFEIGDQTWGNVDKGGALGADKCVVEVKRSYIDWTAPNSDLKVRMGIQGLTTPGAAFGSPLIDDDVAALTLSYAVSDEFALTTFWARLYDGLSDGDGNDEMDVFGLMAPISMDGHKVTPYAIYSKIGENAGKSDTSYIVGSDADAYWLGVAYTMSAFDPFTLKLDFIYGNLDAEDNTKDASGWLIDFKAAYALDMMTPAIIGWYASGDDKNDTESGIMPVISTADAWAPTSFGYVGAAHTLDGNISDHGANGTWGLGIEIADISFVEDLSHVVRFVYVAGNNESDSTGSAKQSSVYFTEDDSAIEIDLNTKYKIYENLTFLLELGYINLDIESVDTENAFKAGFNFIYSF